MGRADLWQLKQRFQISFLRLAGLRPEHELLDVGCGTLRGGGPIIEFLRPGHYCGIDVRADLLSEARKEVRERSLDMKAPRLLTVDDFLREKPRGQFDFAWSYSTLIHMGRHCSR